MKALCAPILSNACHFSAPLFCPQLPYQKKKKQCWRTVKDPEKNNKDCSDYEGKGMHKLFIQPDKSRVLKKMPEN